LIGKRGGYKSHIAYLHLLECLTKPTEAERHNGIIVSLRDDEAAARETLETILRQQEPLTNRRPDPDLPDRPWSVDELEQKQLEIMYFPPGYIAPEEFFHRVFITMQRFKADARRPLTIVFNSVDQIAARFPLCANEGIFIPGLIRMFMAEGITSIFVAVDEPGQPGEQFGLLPMADLILRFRGVEQSQDQPGTVRVDIERRPRGQPVGRYVDLILDEKTGLRQLQSGIAMS
jgi:hypothetical protein